MQIMKKRYDVSDFYKDKGGAQWLARHQVFELTTLVVIGLNSIWIAIDTDYNHADLLVDADWGFQAVENAFCAYFFFEIVIRFIAFQFKRHCLQDMWFMFDSLLVIMMVLETWVVSALVAISVSSEGGQDDSGGSSVKT